MRKVMIVDDEALVRVGLQSIIDWNEYGYEMIGAYKNGAEAWKAVQGNSPDVILTDIEMPEMNGLELIDKVNQQFGNTNIVILSSHEDFDYTRKAIQLNVQDYILKHKLEPQELIRVLNNMNYKNVDHAVGPSISIETEKNELLFFEKNSDSHFNDIFPKQFPKIHSLICTSGSFEWVIFRAAAVKTNVFDSEMKALKVLVSETLKRLDHVLYLGENEQRFHAIFLFDGTDYKTISEASENIIHELTSTVKNQLNVDISTGESLILSKDYSVLPLIRKQAEECLLHYFYSGHGNYIYDAAVEFRQLSEPEWISIQKSLKESIWKENIDEIFRWFEDKGVFLKENYIFPQEAVRIVRMVINYLVDLAMERYHCDLFKVDSPNLEEIFNLHTMDSVETWSELFEKKQHVLRTVLGILEQTRKKRSWIHEATKYIDQYYDQPLQLEDMSKQFNFSLNYFSQKFQQETGYSYTDYLTKVRINKAIELFNTTNQSTDEIAIKVGYPNPNYFVKVFKRTTGFTITEFKNRGSR